MTDEQKEKIIKLRKMGLGYRSIAIAIDLSRDKVRYYCKTQGLDGYGKDYIKPKPEKVFREECKNCGKQFGLSTLFCTILDHRLILICSKFLVLKSFL